MLKRKNSINEHLNLAEKCKRLRDKISMNLYYIDRAHEKLSGSKLAFVIQTLRSENKQLYKTIRMLKCQGRDEIVLTMEPPQF
jgi:hypothetical protein